MTGTRRRAAWLFLLPAGLFYAVFVVWPIAHSVHLSLTDGCQGVGDHFVRRLLHADRLGLDNAGKRLDHLRRAGDGD